MNYEIYKPPNLDLKANKPKKKEIEKFSLDIPYLKFYNNPKIHPISKNKLEIYDNLKMEVLPIEKILDNNKYKDLNELEEDINQFKVEYKEREKELSYLRNKQKELKDITLKEKSIENEIKMKLQGYKNEYNQKSMILNEIELKKLSWIEENNNLKNMTMKLNNEDSFNSKNQDILKNETYNFQKKKNVKFENPINDFYNLKKNNKNNEKKSYYIINGKKYDHLPEKYNH